MQSATNPCESEEQRKSELYSLGKYRHRNLVDLMGFCAQSDCCALVYEFLEQGSFYDNLHEVSSFTQLSSIYLQELTYKYMIIFIGYICMLTL